MIPSYNQDTFPAGQLPDRPELAATGRASTGIQPETLYAHFPSTAHPSSRERRFVVVVVSAACIGCGRSGLLSAGSVLCLFEWSCALSVWLDAWERIGHVRIVFVASVLSAQTRCCATLFHAAFGHCLSLSHGPLRSPLRHW